MPYDIPTYRTLVCLSDGGVMGRSNPAAQPGGFLKGLPSPFWCSSSFKWQILVYNNSSTPADLSGCTATLKARPYNQITADVLLSTTTVIEGNPGHFNCVVFEIERDTLAEVTYSGQIMIFYVEIEATKLEVSTSVNVQTALYQVIELTGPSGDQSETDRAPVPAGRWMGAYNPLYAYWAYDTVSNPDEDGIDCIWMNIAAAGSTGVEPLNANSTTWYCIIRDYTGAWMTSISSALANMNGLDIHYTPGETLDWPGTDPDNVSAALDTLAERVTDLETSVGTLEAQHVGYTPAETLDWPGTDPDDAKEALDTLASRAEDVEEMFKVVAPAGATTATKVYRLSAGTWTLADPDDAECQWCPLYIATGANATAGMYRLKNITDGSLAFGGAVDTPIWLDDNGAITETQPIPDSSGRAVRLLGWVRGVTSCLFDGMLTGIGPEYEPETPSHWPDPDPESYATALDALASRMSDLEAMLDGGLVGEWENNDIDIGTETLVSFAAPTTGAVWKVLGIIDKDTEGQIAFESLISLRVIPDGYGGWTKSVKITLQTTEEDGDCSALSWGMDPTAGDIFTDYDVGTDTVRLRLNVKSDNWYAAGKWVRVI